MVNQPVDEPRHQCHTNAGAQHDQELLFSGHAIYHLTPMLSGDLFAAQRRKGRPVDGRQAGNELERLVMHFFPHKPLAFQENKAKTPPSFLVWGSASGNALFLAQ